MRHNIPQSKLDALERVVSVEHIARLAEGRRSLYHTTMCAILPASVFLHWQAALLVRVVADGRLLIWPRRATRG